MKRRYTHTTTIRLTKEQESKLKAASLAYDLTVSEIVRKFLQPLFDLSETQITVNGLFTNTRKPLL